MRIRDVVVKAAVSAWVFGEDVRAQGTQGGLDLDAIGGNDAAGTGIETTASASTATTATRSAQFSTPAPSQRATKWDLPEVVKLDEAAEFTYYPELPLVQSLGSNFQLLLVQTRAIPPEPVTSKNSWVVVQLQSCKTGEPCTDIFDFPSSDREAMQLKWTFELNKIWDNYVDYKNFFFCIGSKDGGSVFNCQSFSNFFNMESSDQSLSDKDEPGSATNNANNQNAPVQNGQVNQPEVGKNNAQATVGLQTPSGSLILADQTPIVTYEGMPESRKPTQTPVPTSSQAPITITANLSSGTAAATASVNPTSSNTGGGGGGLSKGAIAGIAVGIIGVLSILAAIAILLCLKRRRNAQNGAEKHEQVMLTHAHGENNSQDLLAEKDAVVTTLIHPSSNDTTFSHDSGARQTLIPAGRIDRSHSTREAPTTYHDADDSREIQLAPYSQTEHLATSSTTPFIASSNTSPPRRNPTNASQAPSAVSALSRNTSSSTTASLHLQRSSSTDYAHPLPSQHALSNINEENASSTNIASTTSAPRYGDARHTPTFHTGGADGAISIVHGGVGEVASPVVQQRGSAAPSGFLHASEPGMSEEEMARLEDEERRIDEAIAAAERARGLR